MVFLLVKVFPNAQKNCFDGFHAGRLKVKIKAPPDKGKANEALIEFLADALGLSKSRIHIVTGHTSQLKKIEIDGDLKETFLNNINKD